MMGRWQIKSITITSYVHNNVLSTQNRGNFTASDYLQFNQDGTGYLSLNFAPTNSAFGSMNYTTGGSDQNNVTAINSKGTFAFKILSVDESSMHIIYTQNDRSASIGDRTYEEYQVNVARN